VSIDVPLCVPILSRSEAPSAEVFCLPQERATINSNGASAIVRGCKKNRSPMRCGFGTVGALLMILAKTS